MSCCRDYLALNVYIAHCYYKLNYYDMSQVGQWDSGTVGQ